MGFSYNVSAPILPTLQLQPLSQYFLSYIPPRSTQRPDAKSRPLCVWETRNPHRILISKPEVIDSLMIDCYLAVWLTHLHLDWSISYRDVWLSDRMSCFSYSRTDRFFDWMSGCVTGSLVGSFTPELTDFLTGCLAEWLAVWLTRCSRAAMLPHDTLPATYLLMFTCIIHLLCLCFMKDVTKWRETQGGDE
jgi:hypothetical protein